MKIFALCFCAFAAEDSKYDRRSAGHLYRVFYNIVLTGISKASPEYSTPSFYASPTPSFSPSNPTPLIAQNTSPLFSVTTDQPVSSTWYLNGANQNNNAQEWSHTWDTEGQYNVTYVGANGEWQREHNVECRHLLAP
ncbi:MAG: hypothetical protein L6282_06215 [Candidatus Methanoperedenaceae archaeon]|nr:hypothetical protein [Candidatus Methanoperedenaceae archaeon]